MRLRLASSFLAHIPHKAIHLLLTHDQVPLHPQGRHILSRVGQYLLRRVRAVYDELSAEVVLPLLWVDTYLRELRHGLGLGVGCVVEDGEGRDSDEIQAVS